MIFLICATHVLADERGQADVVLLGEVHDNPGHHARQADYLSAIKPRAIVFEMLTQKQADTANNDARTDVATLEAALDWAATGWPDFAMYGPLFTGEMGAKIYGAAVPRTKARAALEAGIAQTFGEEAAKFGLSDPLDADEQEARQVYQHAVHCDAMPAEMLPVMIGLQRLRDAVLAREIIRAMDETGGPVAVVLGNGHARRDWGVPVYLAKAAPQIKVWSVGQVEDNAAPQGVFDQVENSPAVERPDPCDAFR